MKIARNERSLETQKNSRYDSIHAILEVALLIWIKFWTIMDHGSPAANSAATETTTATSDLSVSRNPSSQGAWLAALIASVAFLIPGGIAFVYFGFSFYR